MRMPYAYDSKSGRLSLANIYLNFKLIKLLLYGNGNEFEDHQDKLIISSHTLCQNISNISHEIMYCQEKNRKY